MPLHIPAFGGCCPPSAQCDNIRPSDCQLGRALLAIRLASKCIAVTTSTLSPSANRCWDLPARGYRFHAMGSLLWALPKQRPLGCAITHTPARRPKLFVAYEVRRKGNPRKRVNKSISHTIVQLLFIDSVGIFKAVEVTSVETTGGNRLAAGSIPISVVRLDDESSRL